MIINARYDLKPTVVGMALALNGHPRQWLWSVTHDAPYNGRGEKVSLRPEVSDFINKAYFMKENQWETYMNSGKVNPVAGMLHRNPWLHLRSHLSTGKLQLRYRG